MHIKLLFLNDEFYLLNLWNDQYLSNLLKLLSISRGTTRLQLNDVGKSKSKLGA